MFLILLQFFLVKKVRDCRLSIKVVKFKILHTWFPAVLAFFSLMILVKVLIIIEVLVWLQFSWYISLCKVYRRIEISWYVVFSWNFVQVLSLISFLLRFPLLLWRSVAENLVLVINIINFYIFKILSSFLIFNFFIG